MKTESQDFVNLQDYEGSIEADKTINRLLETIGDDLDVVFNDMYKKLGKVTTDEAVEDYLADTDNIERVVGWKCIHYDSPEEQDYEEEIAWAEILDWDDR
jgi:23S rRNA U2552 (ribose-2'-O)-methylase RlmE/FtsJ